MAQQNKWWSGSGGGGGPTLYEVLAITPKHLEGQPASAQAKAVKKAYHRALLRHHPDKAGGGGASNNSAARSPPVEKSNPSSSLSTAAMYTVDQIQEAYAVLSDGRRRAEYDRSLFLLRSSSPSSSPSTSRTAWGGDRAGRKSASATASFRTGVETVDLADLGFDERGGGVYYRACRCGNPRGYRFADADLEAFEDDGVLMVECLDCSLWLRVLFAPAGDGDGGEEDGDDGKREEEAVAKQRQQQNREVTGGGGGEGKGWKFNWSFSLGVSVGASASASAGPSGC
ncbi:hypothetical protein DL762_009300 [Monosporascus cannonballus]|uniref:Diphthamide biosynthesis protein 4 n=1 Tax=Monosporascus cannonballus TaxID=155416 RepID=A0ABY0GUM2_9PEZI|nr:hypothetical protein DL762_009300 [Monosporascus cannonballus]